MQSPSFWIAQETAAHGPAVAALADRAFGPDWPERPAARLRRGTTPDPRFSLVAVGADTLLGTVRLTRLYLDSGTLGVAPVWLLGPLAVDPAWRGTGVGSALMARVLDRAAQEEPLPVLLVGDLAYYARFGFVSCAGAVTLRGEDPARILYRPGPQAAPQGRLTGFPAPRRPAADRQSGSGRPRAAAGLSA